MDRATATGRKPSPASRRRRWVARFLLLALSFGAMAFLFEVGLRSAGYEPIYSVYSKPSMLWRKDAQLGWHHEPNRSELYVGPRPWPIEFETRIEINSLGLRGPEVQPVPADGKRVLFMGDSVVAAFEVGYDETFVARIGERLRRSLERPVQVLNAGVRGYGTDQSLLYYRLRGRSLAPDLVVFVHSVNDTRNNMTLHRPRRPFGKPAFALQPPVANGALELVGSPVPDYPLCSHVALDDSFHTVRKDGALARAYCGLETRLADHSALFTFAAFRLRQNSELLHRLWYYGTQEDYQGPAASLPARAIRRAGSWLAAGSAHAAGRRAEREPRYLLTERLLVELAREVRASGAALMLIIRSDEVARIDAAAIRAEGATFHSIVIPDSMTGGRSTRFVNDGHFNAFGHSLAGELLAPLVGEALGLEAESSP